MEKKSLADADRALIQRFIDTYFETAAPRYKIAPQQGNPKNFIPIVRAGAEGTPELAVVQWWLPPSWSKEPRVKFSTFNARIESVGTLASFRESLKKRRCLIPASGWYEWQELPAGNLPWFIHPCGDDLLLFAGLWDHWEREGEVVESCTIIVGPADESVRPFRDRAPYTVADGDIRAWLDPARQDADTALGLLRPFAPEAVAAHRVGKRINSARNDDAKLMDALPEEV